MFSEDTIAAIATPIGEAGVALIRISGPRALAVADNVFRGPGRSDRKVSQAPSHTLHYGWVYCGDRRVDEVMLALMRAPRSYTREDVVEISCHGGILTAKAVLDAVLAGGARLAAPGEFTKRAFLNGRLDLTQAEAVMDLIQAKTELALTAAQAQLSGRLSRRIEALREDLMSALARIEAYIDFPEEDIEPESKAQLLDRLNQAGEQMAALLRTAAEGRLLRKGVQTAIIGRPNAGKSSLLNYLLGLDRAIVSPIPGTTRDTIEETANIRGLPIVFIDTAGLRDSTDTLEKEGIRRSREAWRRADLVLQVLDASEPMAPLDEYYLREFGVKKRLLVKNKIDLPQRLRLPCPAGSVVEVSCATGRGMERLKDCIRDTVWSGAAAGEMHEVMINSRHQEALQRAAEAARRARDALNQEATLEIVALELRLAANAVGEIVGKTTTEDLLDNIFSQFCIGK